MAHTAWIALGSNLGDRKAHLDAALSRLGSVPGVTLHAVSAYQETSPVGGPPGQEPFLNAAAGLVTTLAPQELLVRLHAIEDAAGRVRTDRWGARTLDLDLLLWDEQTIQLDPQRGFTLVVPHPWLPFRRFVLAPLAEIAPATVDPVTGQTVAALLENLDRRPSYVAIDDPQGDWGDALYVPLVSALGARVITCPLVDRGPHDFRIENWSDDLGRERWVVANCWHARFEAAFDRTNQATEPSPDLFQPTFVVGAAPADKAWIRGTPRLNVDPRDAAAALEKVLAACAATRS